MTDRVKGLMVSFKEPIRIDDAEPIMNAIRLLFNVAEVAPSIDEFNDWTNRSMVRIDLEKALLKVLRESGLTRKLREKT